MKHLLRILTIGMVCLIMFTSSACNSKPGNSSEVTSGDLSGVKEWYEVGQDDKLIERPLVDNDERRELLRDLNFSRGIAISKFHANTSGGIPFGVLDYGGKKAEGDNIWSIGQWGCTKNLMDAEMTRNGSVISYFDGSKTVELDTAKAGSVKLGIKGSVEYGKDEEGNYLDRLTSAQNWPHNILGQSFKEGSIAGASRLMWECSYTVEECDRLATTEIDPSLHAAQFQWFVSLSNANEQSESYGQSMWFGFSMFDTRALGKCPAGMSAYDGGKEDSTGLFIYMFSLETVDLRKDYNVVDKPTSVVGKHVDVAVDVLPFLEYGLSRAQSEGAMVGATMDDLVLGSTNIGWEIPGSYDCSVSIDHLNMYVVK